MRIQRLSQLLPYLKRPFVLQTEGPINHVDRCRLDDWLLKKGPEGPVMVLSHMGPTISFGSGQVPMLNVNLNKIYHENRNLYKHSCDLGLRNTGGGTVYFDEGNLLISMVSKESDYEKMKEELVNYLRTIYRPSRDLTSKDIIQESGKNDLVVGDPETKVGGFAYHRLGDHILIQLCLLVHCNLQNLAKYLGECEMTSKLASHGVKSVEARVANLNSLFPYAYSRDDVSNNIAYYATKESPSRNRRFGKETQVIRLEKEWEFDVDEVDKKRRKHRYGLSYDLEGWPTLKPYDHIHTYRSKYGGTIRVYWQIEREGAPDKKMALNTKISNLWIDSDVLEDLSGLPKVFNGSSEGLEELKNCLVGSKRVQEYFLELVEQLTEYVKALVIKELKGLQPFRGTIHPLNLGQISYMRDDCTLYEWCVKEGDLVSKGDPLVSYESFKHVETIYSPVEGRMEKILAHEYYQVPNHSVIGLVCEYPWHPMVV